MNVRPCECRASFLKNKFRRSEAYIEPCQMSVLVLFFANAVFLFHLKSSFRSQDI